MEPHPTPLTQIVGPHMRHTLLGNTDTFGPFLTDLTHNAVFCPVEGVMQYDFFLSILVHKEDEGETKPQGSCDTADHEKELNETCLH
jgi:hypothetical protein